MATEDIEGEATSVKATSIFRGIDVSGNTDWRKTIIERFGLKPEVLRRDYTPHVGCTGRQYDVSELEQRYNIRVPLFDPDCVGKPLLWNNGEKDTAAAGYKISIPWSITFAKHYDEPGVKPENPSMMDLAMRVQQFLA